MGRYENVVVISPDCTKEEEEDLLKRIQANLEKFGSTILKLDDWGIRKLAYPINKFFRGRYYYLRFDGDAPLIAELERRLRLDDKVVRYQSVKIESETGAAAKAVEAEALVEAEVSEVAAEAATES